MRIRRPGVLLILALAAGTPAAGATRAEKSSTPPGGVPDIARAFEATSTMPSSDRSAALVELEARLSASLGAAQSDEERASANFLLGRIQVAQGDAPGARDAFRRALSGGHALFADDAGFAVIRTLEMQGNDRDAAREWTAWEKRYTTSPLTADARLAAAWNALRRGDLEGAEKRLTSATASAPWIAADPRLLVARAALLYQTGKPKDALAILQPAKGRPLDGPAAMYLRALCLGASGNLLKSAAVFQETANRYPDSPLRDHALLAKANSFLAARDYRSAGEEFTRLVEKARNDGVRAEAELRAAGCAFLTGQSDSSLALLRAVVERRDGTDVAARAQFLIGEVLVTQHHEAEAVVELNRVLTKYFQHSVAASAQYRVARCLDRMGRTAEATGAYQAVVLGYSLSPEAPAAAYLAGTGLLSQNKPLAAARYFQLVLDRYAPRGDKGVVTIAAEHSELLEASLCLLEYAYHQAGDLGQLSGAPHLLLERMPPSRSPWRAYTLLIDADASASQARYPEAQKSLEQIGRDFPDHPAAPAAGKLLAWTYARQGRDSLAVATEERLLMRYGMSGDPDVVSGALLDLAHVRFNQKRYATAAAQYEDVLRRFPNSPQRMVALYQAGLCYLRLNRAGDAVDRWEKLVADSAATPRAERAWQRLGDVYFQAAKYDAAARAYRGLLTNFASTSTASIASLRIAQCEYNAGHDQQALEGYADVMARYPGTPAAREAQRGTEASLYRLSQGSQGAEKLARLVEQFPSSPFAADALFQSARHSLSAEHYDEAADRFRQVVSRFPDYSAADQAQYLLAESRARQGRTDEAMAAYEQFLSYFPTSDLAPTVRFRIGLTHYEAKNYMQAAVSFTGVLEDSVTAETRAAALYNLALCERQIGQAAEARAHLLDYRRQFPGDKRSTEVAYQLGELAEAAGDGDAATEEWANALNAGAKPALAAELHYRLGQSHEQKGETAAALASYASAAQTGRPGDTFRLSALARAAALYEASGDKQRALAAYRDIARNTTDEELRNAAGARIAQLAASTRRR